MFEGMKHAYVCVRERTCVHARAYGCTHFERYINMCVRVYVSERSRGGREGERMWEILCFVFYVFILFILNVAAWSHVWKKMFHFHAMSNDEQ